MFINHNLLKHYPRYMHLRIFVDNIENNELYQKYYEAMYNHNYKLNDNPIHIDPAVQCISFEQCQSCSSADNAGSSTGSGGAASGVRSDPSSKQQHESSVVSEPKTTDDFTKSVKNLVNSLVKKE